MKYLVVLLCCSGFAFAHKPFFPEAGTPIEIQNPIISQAHYLQIKEGSSQRFIIPALERAVPVEVLVLDDDLGRSLEMQASLSCDGQERPLTKSDQPFFETFSKLHHRYKVIDTIGPTEQACEISVSEKSGKAGPYTFAIGSEERFDFGDMLGFFSLGEKLEQWQKGY
ncbi:MAG: hypothetical protein KC422_25355 [Trueperaceae bacterium]|nr:hypothetical protein [Trueperaceae bacterium]